MSERRPPLPEGYRSILHPSESQPDDTQPDDDEEEAAREWADMEAAKIGYIWARRWPGGRDW
jgi:hypothetical protein